MKTRCGDCLICELKVLLNIFEYQKVTYMLTSVIQKPVLGFLDFMNLRELKDFIKYFQVNHTSVPIWISSVDKTQEKEIGLPYQNRCL